MKGKNELHINQTTMVAAIQLWLASEFKNPPRAVLVQKDPHRSGTDSFIVTVAEPEGGTK